MRGLACKCAFDADPGSVDVELAVEVGAGTARVLLVAKGKGIGEAAAAGLVRPGTAEDPVTRSQIQAIHDVAAAHGGTFQVDSREGEGFVALLELPRIG